MTRSVFTAQYDRLCKMLIEAREVAGLSQQALSKCLKRPQSYVSKYENRQRRLDVIEFLEIADCLKADAPSLVARLTDADASSPPVGATSQRGRGRQRIDPCPDTD